MTGPEHWREARAELFQDGCEYGCPHAGCAHEMAHLARAQVHATMALAAVTALAETNRYGFGSGREWDGWYRAVTGQPPADDEATP